MPLEELRRNLRDMVRQAGAKRAALVYIGQAAQGVPGLVPSGSHSELARDYFDGVNGRPR